MSETLKMIVRELPRTLGEINHKLLLADLKLALKEVEKLGQQLQQAHRGMQGYPNICKAIITRPGEIEWAYASEARHMLYHLSLLAAAVLEAHNKPTEYGPWAGNDGGEPCPCPACKVAREVMG